MAFEEVPQDASLADPLPSEPLALLARWFEDARRDSGQQNPDAMTLATVDAKGTPQARVVLCRGYDAAAGVLTFYTNRRSAKGRDLASRAEATAVFYWDASSRQARITGPVEFAPDAVSDAYFARRPRLSQLAAWASQQSEPLDSRAALLASLEATAERFGGVDADVPVPRPPHWGGYGLRARRIECWVGAAGRAHDRARWERDPTTPGGWSVCRLQP